eukprot:4539245-Prymnesium_polylepis.1
MAPRRTSTAATPAARARPNAPFRPNARLSDRYDTGSLAGRLRYRWSLCSPLGMRWGEAALNSANAKLASYRKGGLTVTDDSLWHAQRVVEVCAPNGELVPLPFRSAGWALCNTPTIAYM